MQSLISLSASVSDSKLSSEERELENLGGEAGIEMSGKEYVEYEDWVLPGSSTG